MSRIVRWGKDVLFLNGWIEGRGVESFPNQKIATSLLNWRARRSPRSRTEDIQGVQGKEMKVEVREITIELNEVKQSQEGKRLKEKELWM
jgi:hypothetical protein